MTRSTELLRFFEQLRPTDLVDFLVVWAIIYGLLKLVRGTRAVQMAIGLLGVGSALSLILIDVVYSADNIIADIYRYDALAEAVLIAGWAIAAFESRKNHIKL